MVPPAAPPAASPNNARAQTSLIAGIGGWVLWLLLLCFNYSVGLILSLATMGILGLCFAVAGYLPVIPWIVAVVTGHMAMSEIGRTGEGGRGNAIAGLVMGYLGLALTLCTLLIYALALVGLAIPGIQGLAPTPPIP